MDKKITQSVESNIRMNIKELCSPKQPIPTSLKPKLPKLAGIKAVYFDVYGTIMISGTEPGIRNNKEQQEQLLKVTFDAFGLKYKQEAIYRGIRLLHSGIETAHKQKKEAGIDFPEVEIIRIWETLMSVLLEEQLVDSFELKNTPELLTDFVIRYDDPWMMPGIGATITSLHQMGIKTGIISNSSFYTPITLEALTGKTMSELGFNEEDCFWSYKEEIAKPSVRFYEIARHHLSDKYNIEPHEMLFIGNDLLNDVYPAQKAGFNAALFAGDLRSLRLRKGDPRVDSLTPECTISHLTQILECVH